MTPYRKTIYISLGIIFIIASFLMITCSKKNHHKLSQFISPETCGDCHSEIYKQWKNSMHNLAHKDPIYTKVSKFLLGGLTSSDELKEAESCVKCHTPIGFVTGFPGKVSDDLEKTPEIATKGIQCDYCHSATGANKMYNNGLQLDPGQGEDNPGIKRGPFKDSKPDYHKAEFSEFHTSSKICGTCHDVRHVVFDTKLETTYEEWEKGPYNSSDPAKRVECQGCHMYHRPGIPATGSTARPKNPGRASDDAPRREHIFTHYFVGGNSFVPGAFNDKQKSKMAEERLKHAAELKIDGKDIKDGKIKIIVKNTGAGHKLPTGLTDTRQMWLEIDIKDNTGKTIFTSGKLDKNGHITEGTIIYNTIFGDGKGNRIVNIAKAREILKDRRIPPKGSLEETIKLPGGKRISVTVSVKLNYRSAPQKILDMVLGKGKLKLPVVIMSEVKDKIKI